MIKNESWYEKMKKPIFYATHIVKRFGPTIALNDIDIAVYPGEIRGFIGENGSGKSTMSQIMTGIYTRSSGSMFFKDQPWNPKSMMDALNKGIGIAVQENGTISGNSVAENIFLCELKDFSGINFFEKERIIFFSKYFNISLDELKQCHEKYLVQFEKNQPTKSDFQKAVQELKDIKKGLQEKLKLQMPNYISIEKTAYTQKLVKVIEDFNDESKKSFDRILNDNSLDEAFKSKKYKYEVQQLKKRFKMSKLKLDMEHERIIQDIGSDSKAINNMFYNCKNSLHSFLPEDVIHKIKNVFLKVVFGKFVNQKKLNRHARQVLASIGVTDIQVERPMGMYDIQSRKLVEIAKILSKNPDIFIVDETTTALSEDGRQILYKKMNDLKNAGKTVLFISHDLDEIMEKCDTLTVLRDGSIVANLERKDFDSDVIKKFMIGRELKGDYYRSDYLLPVNEKVVLKAQNISCGKSLQNVSLELHEGEIIGIGGLSDCGMHTLGKILFGANHPTEGCVLTGEELDIIVRNEIVAMENNIGYLPKDRDIEALALNDSIYNNIALASIKNILKFKAVVSKRQEREVVKEQVDYLQIKCNSASDLVRTLSGGNKQKVSLGKWLGNHSRILILDCPTRGVDIGVKQFIYQLMNKLKQENYAILMISEELPELIGMCDKLLIMKDGRISKEFMRSPDLKQEDIVEYML